MTEARLERLIEKLERGGERTGTAFKALPAAAWGAQLHPAPGWQVRSLLAHFVSAEVQLLALAQDIAGGGQGAPHGMDIDQFNAREQERLAGFSPAQLLTQLEAARRQTIDWVRTLNDDQLNRVGRHPVLGDVSLELLIESIYGHQLFHMRELMQVLGSFSASS